MIRLFTAVAALWLAAGGLAAGERDFILRVQSVPNAWTTDGLEDALVTRLTRDQSIRVIVVDPGDPAYPPFPNASLDLDSLTNWGVERGGRYLLSLVVKSQRIERRKSFHLPLVFHKWETVGVLEGEYRFVDLRRGRLLAGDRFTTELPAKRVFQATMDDNKYDPDIHLRPDEKGMLFAKLYDESARQLLELTAQFTGGR
ncbi:MAG: hypothetical protein RBT76_00870 [candidate division Zixibacteria bacterium]|jgi:hypothetical protein|nr:hypothetical protein [candidate division Zixibacteria bacterium]